MRIFFIHVAQVKQMSPGVIYVLHCVYVGAETRITHIAKVGRTKIHGIYILAELQRLCLRLFHETFM